MAYKTFKQGEEGFRFVNDKFSVPRAVMKISGECPTRYQEIIRDAVNNGWLTVKVNVPESELMWGELQK
jgi:hypothetical protein